MDPWRADLLEGPVALTNTHSVGVVRDAIIQWGPKKNALQPWGCRRRETYDGGAERHQRFHVKRTCAGARSTSRGRPAKEGGRRGPACSVRLKGCSARLHAAPLDKGATPWAFCAMRLGIAPPCASRRSGREEIRPDPSCIANTAAVRPR